MKVIIYRFLGNEYAVRLSRGRVWVRFPSKDLREYEYGVEQ